MTNINPNTTYTGSDGSKITGRDLENFISEKVNALSKKQESLKIAETSAIKSVFRLDETVEQYKNTVASAFDVIVNSLEKLDVKGTEIMKTLGTTRSRLGEFKAVYAEALPSLTEMGFDGDPSFVISQIGNALGGAASLGVEAITEIAATSNVTGEQIGTLAENFRDVGVSIYDVGETMKEVVDYTRSVGGNVTDVSSKVVSNLDKLNMFNFSNGVAGLTKMAAQASRLGIDMNKVFETSEKLLNPESAIEMAAGLQRLGVANSEMLDPLRLMDMGLNGPDELMKSMTELSKEFVQLNEKGQFEIMPGAKRRMREVAQELGMSASEFSKLAIKSADFDRKLQEIKMPSFIASDEQKEMIASMAQMKEGKAVITVKDAKTGLATEREVDQLTPEDIENLKLSDEERGKTMEEIAIDQLDTLKRIQLSLAATGQRIGMAGAITPSAQRVFDAAASIQTRTAEGVKDFRSFGDISDDISKAVRPLEQMAVAISKGDFTKVKEDFEALGKTLANLGQIYKENIINQAKKTGSDISKDLEKIYNPVTSSPGGTTVTPSPRGSQSPATATPTGSPPQTPINVPATASATQPLTQAVLPTAQQMEYKVNNSVTVDFKISTDANTSNIDKTVLAQAITDYFRDPANLNKLKMDATQSGLLLNVG